MLRLALCLMLAAAPLAAQQRATLAYGGTVRVLDKTTGRTQDLSMRNGQTADLGLMQLRLDECRHPVNNPSGDAFAKLIVTYGAEHREVFRGWMIASAPGLSAMDHPRFDVWVLRCNTS